MTKSRGYSAPFSMPNDGGLRSSALVWLRRVIALTLAVVAFNVIALGTVLLLPWSAIVGASLGCAFVVVALLAYLWRRETGGDDEDPEPGDTTVIVLPSDGERHRTTEREVTTMLANQLADVLSTPVREYVLNVFQDALNGRANSDVPVELAVRNLSTMDPASQASALKQVYAGREAFNRRRTAEAG